MCRLKFDRGSGAAHSTIELNRRWIGLAADCPQRILTGLQQSP